MRKGIWLATILTIFAMPRISAAQQASQSMQTSQSTDKQASTQSKTPAQTPTKGESVADAARKAREAEKTGPKAPMVFTNDNIPTSSSGVSVVGKGAPAAKESTSADAKTSAAEKSDETTWRQKFADARHKIEQDKAEISVMQQELSQLNVQYYPNPTQGLMQSVSRTDITNKQNAIDAKQKELSADQQTLSNLEDELRKAGGDSAWARE